MSRLLLGPLLRHVDDSTATVWVKTSAAATVGVRAAGRTATTPTFCVRGHHFALVVLPALDAATEMAYVVTIDGEDVWPDPEDSRPPPTIRTLPAAGERGRDVDIVFGSCRTDRPHEEPYTLSPEEHPEGVGHDALVALSRECQSGRRPIPDLLLMLGDQVYADEGLSPRVRERQVERRGPDSEPRTEVLDFEEYTWLYADTWSAPDVRWLLATVPTAMIFDDHDVRDDWNTSDVWRRSVEALPWWRERITGAYMSYWVYQHLGNQSPAAIEREGRLRDVLDATARTGDAGDLVRDFTAGSEGAAGLCWSYVRHLTSCRVVVVDTRSGRVLDGGRRDMLSEEEWASVERELRGDVGHLVVASSLPLFLERSLHDLEGWNERLAGGAWGRAVAGLAERMRQAVDLEHWAAFQHSFERIARRLGEVAGGRHGPAPASILVLSGDVHHSYVAPVRFGGGGSPVLQVVSSPLRNAFPRSLQRGFRFAHGRAARGVGALLRRTAGLPEPSMSWTVAAGPYFGNGLGSLRLSDRRARIRLECARGPETLERRHEETVGNGAR